MNISEASATATLLREYIDNSPNPPEKVWDAAEYLAERINKALHAGDFPHAVAEARKYAL